MSRIERGESADFEDKLPDEDHLRQLIKESNLIEGALAKSIAEQMKEGKKVEEEGPDVNLSQSMVCDRHKAPAIFFSHKEERYVCFKCLVSQEKLLYIDKRYKEQMDDFERIKALTVEAI